MRLIISPAKTMVRKDSTLPQTVPALLPQTRQLLAWLQGLSRTEAQTLWKCNDKLADLNYERVQQMDLTHALTPAVLAYEGIQYRYMAPGVMEGPWLDYMQANLRILSGFYGILRPFDGIAPYRLELQAPGAPAGYRDLYHFWGDALYQELTAQGDGVIANLASKEYSRAIEPFLQGRDRFVTVVFAEEKAGKLVQKATMAKMARGEMVRYAAEQQAQTPEALQHFDRLGFRYAPAHSSAAVMTFLLNR